MLCGSKTKSEEILITEFMQQFVIIALNEEIAQEALYIRRKYKIRLPDAIILATANVYKTVLVTRDTKDFSAKESNIILPYQL